MPIVLLPVAIMKNDEFLGSILKDNTIFFNWLSNNFVI